MPISLADENQALIIRRITGDTKMKKHLENLGFVVGEEVKVVHRVGENLILKVKGVSLAISEDLARRIIV